MQKMVLKGIPVNKYIDHTLLKPDATADQIIKLCEEAREYNFMSVCINPSYVSLTASELADTDVKICTVVGFPLGATDPYTKATETEEAIIAGADEIDMVINIGALKSAQYLDVLEDIKAVREASYGKILKVIIECALLTDEEKITACKLSVKAGADFVKTSTGFSKWGAKVEDVKLMKQTVGDRALVKAAGGVHSLSELKAMVEAGASRIGASSGVEIMNDKTAKSDY